MLVLALLALALSPSSTNVHGSVPTVDADDFDFSAVLADEAPELVTAAAEPVSGDVR